VDGQPLMGQFRHTSRYRSSPIAKFGTSTRDSTKTSETPGECEIQPCFFGTTSDAQVLAHTWGRNCKSTAPALLIRGTRRRQRLVLALHRGTDDLATVVLPALGVTVCLEVLAISPCRTVLRPLG
jgi:hypothetical protein